MNFSWKNFQKVIGELTTSNKLGQAEAKLITDSIEADALAVADAGTDAPPTPVAVAAPVPAPVSAPAPSAPVAVAAAPAVPVAVATENEELVRLRAENAQLKAKVTPGLAAAVPTEDATQTGKGTTANEGGNKYFAKLKRIKEKHNRFGLTALIDLGETE